MSSAAPIRFKLTVAYRGTAYCGWQTQLVPGGEELPTVQTTLRQALQRVVNHPVTVVGSSRTDSGVHAAGQVAHFDCHRPQILPEKLLAAVNAKLPADVAILRAKPVDASFDAIGSTVRKAYRYTLRDVPIKDVFTGNTSFHVGRPLDDVAMRTAITQLVGTHDFASFAKPGHGRESTIRTIESAAVVREGPAVHVDVVGTGFLWHQVRIIVGTLVEIGLGRRTPDDITAMLAAKNRQAAGPTAPPHGLCLQWIETS
ncbi:MAG: tRNA pseudouridine(38-40) synthase TruA [Planctomycetota bacterium]